jgi:hypothetical protein
MNPQLPACHRVKVKRPWFSWRLLIVHILLSSAFFEVCYVLH